MTPRPRKATSRYESSGHEGIERDKRSEIYYFRDTVEIDKDTSKFVEKSLKTKDLKEAIKRAKLVRAEVVRRATQAEEEPEAKVTRHEMSTLFDLVLKKQEAPDIADGTHDQAKSIIENHLRPWFCGRDELRRMKGRGSKRIEVILPPAEPHCRHVDTFLRNYTELWLDYKTAQAGGDPNYPVFNAKRKLGHDRRYLVMALLQGHRKLDENERRWVEKKFDKTDFELRQVKAKRGKYIPDEDVQEILAKLLEYAARSEERTRVLREEKPELARPIWEFPKKHYLQVLLAVTTGMRKREILHLSKDEIDLELREIDLDPGRIKTRRPREVPIPVPDDVFPLLKEAYEAAPGKYLFPAQLHSVEGRPIKPDQPQNDNRYYWDKVREETGLELIFHDFRRTAITNMVKAGLAETAIRQICGVEGDTMREVYAFLERGLRTQFRGLFRGKFAPAVTLPPPPEARRRVAKTRRSDSAAANDSRVSESNQSGSEAFERQQEPHKANGGQ